MLQMLKLTAFTGGLLNAAIFGFFYAWVCSTMWGLDAADPKVAIVAMQAMNASVRNVVFAPAFFGTPLVLLLAGVLAIKLKYKNVAMYFAVAGLLYLGGGMFLTMAVNVPMNRALGLVEIPENLEQATTIWQVYSVKWQFWNQTRTIFSGVSFIVACMGLYKLGQKNMA